MLNACHAANKIQKLQGFILAKHGTKEHGERCVYHVRAICSAKPSSSADLNHGATWFDRSVVLTLDGQLGALGKGASCTYD